MEINLKKSAGFEVLSKEDFISKFHPGLTRQAVVYAMEAGKIDFVRIGNCRHVAMTATTMLYKPKEDAQRDEKNSKNFSGGRSKMTM